MRTRSFVILLGLLLLLSACLPITAPVSIPLETETQAPPTTTPTATIVWFPATPTNTPLPTPTLSITPTLDTRPVFGAVLYKDDFSAPGGWALGVTGSGSIALGKNELSLAISREKGSLVSINRQGSYRDFYAEITASPSICRGADEYGFLFHVTPGGDFFRFSLTCEGKVRVDRFFKGKASSPQPLTMSGMVPRGAPSNSRLAVSSIGRQMLFYINGVYLFSVSDPSLPVGMFGVFSRAAGADAVTVSFSDLVVYEPTP